MLTYLFRVFIATIRDKGGCPYPRCLIPKQYLPRSWHDLRHKAMHRAALLWHHTMPGKNYPSMQLHLQQRLHSEQQECRQLAQRGILCAHGGELPFPICDFQLTNSSTFSECVFVTIGWGWWWIQFFYSIGRRSHAWVWAGSLESTADSPYMNSTHPRWRHSDGVQLPVIKAVRIILMRVVSYT